MENYNRKSKQDSINIAFICFVIILLTVIFEKIFG
jgi:hypothetical protein